MLLVCRFGPEETGDGFLDRARHAMGLLARQPGCERVDLGRSLDEPGEWVLVAVFTSLTDYRRALAPFEVREHVVPFLSAARTDAPATFERRLTALGGDGDVEENPSILE